MPTAIRKSEEPAFEAKISKCAEENPELAYELIKEILLELEELDNGEKTEYQFGNTQ
jgi:hypothetical protein